jgi:outer membrane receptor protein involved in Fe transport
LCGSAIKRTFAPEFEKDMNRIFVLGLMALASVSTCYADAENILDESAVADTSKVVDLDEVVVVAQPKEGFLLRQQPLSSSVFGAKELQQMNVQSLGQLSYYVPSFTMPEYGSRLTSSMYIRGVGSRINNSAVGIYYDHIPLMSKSAFNTHFYMLDRVDVLRGAQGTLYGANTEGGIVRIYSKNPMSYQGTDVNIGVGTHFTRKAEVAHYQRLGDELAFMVAAFYNGQDGFFKNSNLNEMGLHRCTKPTDRC